MNARRPKDRNLPLEFTHIARRTRVRTLRPRTHSQFATRMGSIDCEDDAEAVAASRPGPAPAGPGARFRLRRGLDRSRGTTWINFQTQNSFQIKLGWVRGRRRDASKSFKIRCIQVGFPIKLGKLGPGLSLREQEGPDDAVDRPEAGASRSWRRDWLHCAE